jgi:hypothetical protein
MNELNEQMRGVDEVPFRDDWDKIQQRAASAEPIRDLGGRNVMRAVAISVATLVVLGATLYGLSGLGSSTTGPSANSTSSDLATYVNPMGIPITLDYPSDWYAQSVSQPLLDGLVISNAAGAMPSPGADSPSPGPLPENPNLPANFVTLTVLARVTHGPPAPDSPLPLSMADAKVVPGPANIRTLEARVAGIDLEISLQGGQESSASDIAAADAIVASIRPAPATDVPSPPHSSVQPSGQLTSESMMLRDSPGVRCTATLPTVIGPAEQIPLAIEIQNASEADVEVTLGEADFSVKAGDGTVWDTTTLTEGSMGGGFILPKKLGPGEQRSLEVAPLAVQFPGPLVITPTCLGEAMAPIPTDVSESGPTPTPDEALASAITATSGLFGPCAPTVTDSATGTIQALTEATMTMDVRCSAQVTTEAGFSVVTLEMSTPSNKPAPKISDGIVTPPDLASDAGAAETLVWRFVVTWTDVFPVGSATQFRTKSADAMDTQFLISPKGWRPGSAAGCGGNGIVAGGDGRTATISFYNACG